MNFSARRIQSATDQHPLDRLAGARQFTRRFSFTLCQEFAASRAPKPCAVASSTGAAWPKRRAVWAGTSRKMCRAFSRRTCSASVFGFLSLRSLCAFALRRAALRQSTNTAPTKHLEKLAPFRVVRERLCKPRKAFRLIPAPCKSNRCNSLSSNQRFTAPPSPEQVWIMKVA
jgi:hypothetical protein